MRAKETSVGLTWAGRGQGERHERSVWKPVWIPVMTAKQAAGRRGPAHEVEAVLAGQHMEARLTAQLDVA